LFTEVTGVQNHAGAENRSPHRIRAVYRITTPLFLGGAEKDTKAELRAPSFKGVLRFWYRAAALPRLGTWQEVAKEERNLFGSSDTGQGRFLVRLTAPGGLQTAPPGQPWAAPGSAYMGYGIIGPKGAIRPYIKPGGLVAAELLCRPGTTTAQTAAVKKALTALGLFGGMGSRPRHGFGSLSLESLSDDGQEEWIAPRTATELQERITSFLGDLGPLRGELPPYTAFSGKQRIIVCAQGKDALDVLDRIGRQMITYRSYGKSQGQGKPHRLPWGEAAHPAFPDDHDLVGGFVSSGKADRHPRRVAFGLPHNYFFSGPKIKVNVKPVHLERRASPLFVHIHALEAEGHAAVLTLLPAVFLPPGEEIVLGGPGGREVRVPVDVKEYGDVNAFLDGFTARLEVTQ